MSPVFTFFIGLLFLVLFGWYFATDYGLRKRLIATLLAVLLVAFSIATIWRPEKNIALGLDIKGGTSFSDQAPASRQGQADHSWFA